MSTPVEGTAAWRASIERPHPIRALNPADPAGNASAVSPWQALMAQAAIGRGERPAAHPSALDSDWRPRVEPAPAREPPPGIKPDIKDSPDRIETARAATPAQPGAFETGSFSLADVIDIINPLQHIPIVSTIYRELTGDQIGHAARLAGDVLFLGPLGGLTAMANILVQESSGKDIGEHALALFRDDQPATAVANNNATPVANNNSSAVAGDENALAALLPPGAMPIPGGEVDFAADALKPAAFAGQAPAEDVPPPPPRTGPIAAPGWKDFYSPPENEPAPHRALPPDPMAALVARRTPGSMAAAVASTNRLPRELPPEMDVPNGAIAQDGGWFSDVMLSAMTKYEHAQRLRQPAIPEAALKRTPGNAVNIVN